MAYDMEGRFLEYSARNQSSMLVSVVSKWLSIFGILIVTFLMTPFIIGKVGNYGYGIWVILTSLLGYYGLLTLGIGSAVSRYMSLHLGGRDYQSLLRVFNTAFIIFLLIGLAVSVVVYQASDYISLAFQGQNSAELSWLISLAGLSVALSFPSSIMSAAIVAHELYAIHSIMSLLSVLFRAGLSVSFLEFGFETEGVVFAFLCSVILDIVMNYLVIKFKIPWITYGYTMFSAKTFRSLIAFGLPTVVISLSALLRTDLDAIVIGAFIGIEQVAVYSVAALIVKYIFTFSNTGLSVFTSRYARLIGAGRSADSLFFSSLFFASAIASLSLILVYLFGEAFITLWLGEGYGASYNILVILMSAYLVTIMQIPGYNYLIALNRHKVFAVIILIEGVLNVVISIYLAKEIGIIGVALGTAIPMFIMKIFVQPFYVTKNTGVTLFNYLMPMIIPVLLGFVTYILGSKTFIDDSVRINSWLIMVTYIGLFVVFYVSILYVMVRIIKPELLRLT